MFFLTLSSCDSSSIGSSTNVPVQNEVEVPTGTIPPPPIKTAQPTKTTTITPTNTPFSSSEPGSIITLGEANGPPWYSGIPAFSSDSKIIALAASRIRLWDAQTYQLIHEFENPYADQCEVSNAGFSPDSHLFAASITDCEDETASIGYLFIWDVKSGKLLKKWPQNYAYMPPARESPVSLDFSIPVYAFAFLPNSTKIVFASGNTLEIRDVLKDEEPVIIDLGSKMFASQISLPSDGRFIYVLMVWTQDHDYPAHWRQQKKIQIWDTKTHILRREIEYPDSWYDPRLQLHNASVIQFSYEKGTAQVSDLETDEIREFPFRRGEPYVSSDLSFIIYARFFELDQVDKTIELWNTDTWRNPYTFKPEDNLTYAMDGIIFSPDNATLAISHQERVTLWNIRPIVAP